MENESQAMAGDQPSWHWLAYVSPVTSIMALTMFLAQDRTSSLVYTVVSIVCGVIGLLFSGKAPKVVWPILSSLVGIGFACYVGWLAYNMPPIGTVVAP